MQTTTNCEKSNSSITLHPLIHRETIPTVKYTVHISPIYWPEIHIMRTETGITIYTPLSNKVGSLLNFWTYCYYYILLFFIIQYFCCLERVRFSKHLTVSRLRFKGVFLWPFRRDSGSRDKILSRQNDYGRNCHQQDSICPKIYSPS